MSEPTPEVPGDYTAAENADGLPRDTYETVTGEDAQPIEPEPEPEPEPTTEEGTDVSHRHEERTTTEVVTEDAPAATDPVEPDPVTESDTTEEGTEDATTEE